MKSMPAFKGKGVIVSGENVAITANVTDKGVELLTVYERQKCDDFSVWFPVYCGRTAYNTVPRPSADDERVDEWNRRVRR